MMNGVRSFVGLAVSNSPPPPLLGGFWWGLEPLGAGVGFGGVV